MLAWTTWKTGPSYLPPDYRGLGVCPPTIEGQGSSPSPSAPGVLLGKLLFECYQVDPLHREQNQGDQRDKVSLFPAWGREPAHLVLGISPGPGSPVGSRESI